MRKRLRKKKHLGEYQRLGFHFTASLPGVPFGGDAETLRRFSYFLRENGLASWSFIGTGCWEFFVWHSEYPGLTSDAHRVLVMDWLKAEPMIDGADMSVVYDIWAEDDNEADGDA
jgi:uncharacterized protein YggL (DUF469 family)